MACYKNVSISTMCATSRKSISLGEYRKIPIISPRLIFAQKAFCWAYFRGGLFSEGLIIGRNLAFQNGLGLTIETA